MGFVGYIGDINHSSKYLIFITTWEFILLNIYQITAAISCTVKYISENFVRKSETGELSFYDISDPPVLVCCCTRSSEEPHPPTIPWYLQVMWLLYIVTSQVSIPVVIFYWFLGETVRSWPANLHEHALIIIPGFIDLFVSGYPLRFYHFIYPSLFGTIYFLFTLIYYFAGGTDSDGESSIYSLLDYEENPSTAALLIIMMLTVIPVVCNSIYWGLYLLRNFLVYKKIEKNNPSGMYLREPSRDSSAALVELDKQTSIVPSRDGTDVVVSSVKIEVPG